MDPQDRRETICRWLSPDQHRDYQAWIDNDRRLHDLLAWLEALGTAALDADPRWERQASQPAEPEPKCPDSVGSDRLTCERPSTQPPHAQLRAKREDLSSSARSSGLVFHDPVTSQVTTAWRPDARRPAVCPGRWRPPPALRTSQDVARIALSADAGRATANLASVV